MGIAVFPTPASGPSLAEITTAIQTNAAPASVTNASIATQVTNNASPFNATWTELYANTSAIGAASVSVTGLSSYKYIQVSWFNAGASSAGAGLIVRFNNDSSNLYSYFFPTLYGSNGGADARYGSYTTGLEFANLRNDGPNNGWFTILGANNSTGPKQISIQGGSIWDGSATANYSGGGFGYYRSNSAISSIQLVSPAANFTTGTRIAILGGN